MAAPMLAARRIPVIVILGATGVGKSKLGIELASRFNGEIISADSMQIYKGLDIITNKVTRTEQEACVHHMINVVSPLVQNYTVTQFRNMAVPIIDNIVKEDKIPIIVGGTNYYIESLLWDLLIEDKTTESVPAGSITSLQNQPRDGSTSRSEQDDCLLDDSSGGGTSRGHQDDAVETFAEYQKLSTGEIHDKLLEVDIDSAHRIHPNDRRKMLRALQVALQSGTPLSRLLAAQHAGGGRISGDLRYPDTLVFWITCQQEVLDDRTDRRVDEMIQRGLLKELMDFHLQYNALRMQKNQGEADYTLGIFQSIGLKEFHAYLTQPESKCNTEKGQQLLKQGIEEMKRVTRRYARKQRKWVTSRFLKRPGIGVPPVYTLDATDLAVWSDKVLLPAEEITQAYIDRRESRHEPVPWEENLNRPEHNVCEVCGRTFVTTQEWNDHLKGKKHHNSVKRQKFEEFEKLNGDTDSGDVGSPRSSRDYKKRRWLWQQQQLAASSSGQDTEDPSNNGAHSNNMSPSNSELLSNSELPGNSEPSINSEYPSDSKSLGDKTLSDEPPGSARDHSSAETMAHLDSTVVSEPECSASSQLKEPPTILQTDNKEMDTS